jgi:hypothetical protein
MQLETPARTISFLYQNHQDTPSEIRDLHESISIPERANPFLSGRLVLSTGPGVGGGFTHFYILRNQYDRNFNLRDK